MNIGVKRTQRDYTLAFKLAVVEQVERGEMTYLEVQVRYGTQSRSTVLTWLRKYGLMDWYNPPLKSVKLFQDGTRLRKKYLTIITVGT